MSMACEKKTYDRSQETMCWSQSACAICYHENMHEIYGVISIQTLSRPCSAFDRSTRVISIQTLSRPSIAFDRSTRVSSIQTLIDQQGGLCQSPLLFLYTHVYTCTYIYIHIYIYIPPGGSQVSGTRLVCPGAV